MASDLTTSEPADIVKPDVSPVDRPTAPTPTGRPHRMRFLVVYAALAAALAAGIVGVVALAGKSGTGSAQWSSWQPTGGGLGAAEQIARHVAPRYRLANGNQLVDVLVRAPSLTQGRQTIPVQVVGVAGSNGKFGEAAAVSPTASVMYLLCGLGQSCTIASGAPSVERGELVRREILELALYTFKYVPGADSVFAFMPPATAKKQAVLVYLRKSDVAAELGTPLDDLLSPKVPGVSTIAARPREVRLIDTVVTPRAFNPVTLTTTQGGDSLLVLSPLRTSAP